MDTRGVVRLNMPGDGRPTAREYLRFLTTYCVDWKAIGLQLGLRQAALNVIGADNHNHNRECLRLTLESWLQLDIHATWSKLELAITNANRVNLGIDPLDTINEDDKKLQGLLNKAVQNGETIQFQHIKIFLTGSSAAGKTSFRRSLFMEPFIEEYESTRLQETKHAYMASILESKDGEATWLELTAEQQIDHFKSLLESQRAEKLARELDASNSTDKSINIDHSLSSKIHNSSNKNNYKAPKVLIEKLDKSDGLESHLVIPDPVKLITVVDTGGQPEFIHMLPAIVNCPTINFVVIDMTKKLTDKVEVHYKEKEDIVQKKGKEEDILKQDNRVKVEVQCRVKEEDKLKNDDIIEVIHYKAKTEDKVEDQAKKGSKVKVEVHYKVKEDNEVKEKDNVEIEVHYKDNRDKIPLSYLSYTYEDLIKLLMSITNDSVNQSVAQKPEIDASINKQKDAEEEKTKSYIGFVGTHKDITSSEVINELNKQLAILVGKEKQEKFHVSVLGTNEKYLHPVDNTKSGSSKDNEVVEIRKQIEMVTEDMALVPVPIAWMILEIQVKSFCIAHSKPYITLEVFSDIAYNEASVESKEVYAVLQYFNSLGIFLYFKDVPEMQNYVIINHQWFYNTLCKITCLLCDSSSIIDHDSLEIFKKDGLLHKKKLMKMKFDDKIKIEFFVALLLNMKIIACYKKEFYYIPYVLPHCQHYHDKYKYLLLEPLLVRFSSGFLPRGFFCSLVVHLLQELPSKQWSKVDFCQNYRNVITFNINDVFYLRLQDQIYYLEIQVRHYEYCKKRCVFPELKILCEYLHYVCTKLKLDPNKLEYGFLCHGDSEDEHMVKLDSIKDPANLENCKKCKKRTQMGPLHKIWFEGWTEDEHLSSTGKKRRNSSDDGNIASNKSKNDDEVTVSTAATVTTLQETPVTSGSTATTHNQSEVWNKLPEMWQVNKIVVPLVMAHWEDVAYNSLHYDIPTVEGIDAKHKSDPKRCCQELLKDWLKTDRGVGPKTWETLLKQLEEVPELIASVEKIKKQLAT